MTPDEVREARLRAGLSQADLADLLGVNVRTVKSWESGRHEISRAMSIALEAALSVRPTKP